MIKVLHVVGKMDQAGLETFIMNYYRSIDRTYIEFDFIILSGKKGFYDDEILSLGGKIFYCPKQFSYKNSYFFKKWFCSIVDNEEFDILHSHNGGAGLIIFPIAKKKKIVTICHAHNSGEKRGSFLKKKLRIIARKMSYKYIDYFFACSNEAGKYFFPNKNFIIINNAINLEKFKFNIRKRNEIRNTLNLNNKFVIGTIGRLTDQKNPKFILDIFETYFMQDSNSILLWIGKGEMEQFIKEEIVKRNLLNQVILYGNTQEVYDLLQAFDVFILPSKNEGLGIVAIESQAAGVPTLCSDNVPNLASVTNLFHSLPITDAVKWVECIKCIKNSSYKRSSDLKLIEEKGFNLDIEAVKLVNLYIRMSELRNG